jgi:hypothetical protein
MGTAVGSVREGTGLLVWQVAGVGADGVCVYGCVSNHSIDTYNIKIRHK